MGPTSTGARLVPGLQGANRSNAANQIVRTGGRLGAGLPKPIPASNIAAGGSSLGLFGTVATFLGGFIVTTGILGAIDMNAQKSSAEEFRNVNGFAPGELSPEIIAQKKKARPAGHIPEAPRAASRTVNNKTIDPPISLPSAPELSAAQKQFQQQMQLQQLAFDVENFNFSQSNIASNAYIAALTNPITILGNSDQPIEINPLQGESKYKNGETYNSALNRTLVKQQQYAQKANQNSHTSQIVIFQRPIPGGATALSRFTGNKAQLTHLLNKHFITAQDLQNSGADLNKLNPAKRQQNEPPTERRQPEIGHPSRPMRLPKQKPQERAKGDAALSVPTPPETAPTGDNPKNAKPVAVEIEPSSTPVEFPIKNHLPHFPNSQEQQSTVFTTSPVEQPFQTYPMEVPTPENKLNPNNPLEITGIFGRGSQRGRGADGEKSQAQKDLEARIAQSEAEHAERLRQAQAAENDPNTEVGRRNQQIREEAQQKATQAYFETGKIQDVNDFIDQPSRREERKDTPNTGNTSSRTNTPTHRQTNVVATTPEEYIAKRGKYVPIPTDARSMREYKDLVKQQLGNGEVVIVGHGKSGVVFAVKNPRTGEISNQVVKIAKEDQFTGNSEGFVRTTNSGNVGNLKFAVNDRLEPVQNISNEEKRDLINRLRSDGKRYNEYEIKPYNVGRSKDGKLYILDKDNADVRNSDGSYSAPGGRSARPSQSESQPSSHLSAKEQKRLNELENRTGFLNGRSIWEDQELEKLREKATQRPAQPDNSTSTPSSSDSSPPSNNSENLTPREQRELEKLENPGLFGRDMWEDRRLNELRQKRDGS